MLNPSKPSYIARLYRNIRTEYELYILSIPAFAFIVIFAYIPMSGIQIAFREYIVRLGFWKSPWVGFAHFERFFSSYNFWKLIGNTLGISLYSLAVGFPLPIILALMLNEVKHRSFKKSVQMITYAPHFISTVVIVGMMAVFLSPSSGLINMVIRRFGGTPISFMAEPAWFKTLFVFSGVWQNVGYSSIIYISALSSVDMVLYEAARVDGASKFQKILNIDIPCLFPTIVILLIMSLGRIMSVGFEKILLMQNSLNMSASDVLSTYVYRLGIQQGDYSFTTAVGLFNNLINLMLLVTVNRIASRLTETSLW